MLTMQARGKINLSLNVIQRLANGYHQVEMVMQQVAIGDEVTVSVDKAALGVVSLTSNMPGVPLDETNIAYKAAKLICQEYNINLGISIHLEKKLPLEAGLAGGSSNGAAVLVGLNQLLDLKCSTKQLMKLGAKLGSDVPFCILGGTALACGTGTELTSLANRLKLSIILVKPPFGAATGLIYQSLELEQHMARPNTQQVIQALQQGDTYLLTKAWGNVLESVTFRLYPEIATIKNQLIDMGIPALMSGSGTTVFGVIPNNDQQLATKAGEFFIKKPGYKVFLTTTI